jgi:flotillin
MQEILENLLSILPVLIGVISLIIVIAIGHIKVPPNTAVIISGLRKEPRVLIGRTGIKVPFLERVDRLPLKQMVMEVNSGRAVSTLDYMSIQVFAVIKLKISEDPQAIKKAMKNFLNQYPEETMGDLQNPLQAILREIAGTKKLNELIKDKEGFANQLHKRASVNLDKLGIEIISCVIKTIEDEAGLIKALGVEQTTEIHKRATILKAEADREIAIKSAETKREVNDAHVLSEAEIAKKNNELAIKQAELKQAMETKQIERELEIAEKNNVLNLRKANLKKIEGQKQAEAEIAFEEATLAKRRSFEIAQAQMLMDKEERQLKLKEKAAQVQEKVLEAEVKQTAEADRYKQQQIADGHLYTTLKATEAQKLQVETANYIAEQEIQTSKSRGVIKKQEADIELYIQTQEAKATKIKAEADAYIAEQEANVVKITGLCEAEIIKAKGIAEAHALKLKAEAMKDYDQAAIVEMIVSVLPEIAKNISQPISEIDHFALASRDTNANTGMSKEVLDTMVKVQEVVEGATGVELKKMTNTNITPAKDKSKKVIKAISPEVKKS